MRFLSDEWLAAASSAVSGRELPDDGELIIEQTVTAAPGGTVVYHLVCAGGRCRIEAGPHEDADVRFKESYETAAAIAQGHRSAQEAFMVGDLKLDGDVTVLIRRSEVVNTLAAALSGIAGSTEF